MASTRCCNSPAPDWSPPTMKAVPEPTRECASGCRPVTTRSRSATSGGVAAAIRWTCAGREPNGGLACARRTAGTGSGGLQVFDDQLDGPATAVVVRRQPVRQVHLPRWRAPTPATEVDGAQPRTTGGDLQLEVALADHPPVLHLEHAVELRLGERLAPRPPFPERDGHLMAQLARRQFAIAGQLHQQHRRIDQCLDA